MSKVPSDHEYFFAVGSPETVMSSVWRVWTWPGKSDIYISEKGLVGSYKASLHQDGSYRLGFAKQFVRKQQARGNWTRRDRAADEWKATEVAPGIQMPLRLLIPASGLRPVLPDWSTTKPVVWLDVPPPDFAYEVRLYLGNTRVRDSITIYSPDRPITELWKRPLPNGWWLVLVVKVGPLPAQERQKIEDLRRKIQASVSSLPAPLPAGGRLRVKAHGYADDGSRHVIDMAVDVAAANPA